MKVVVDTNILVSALFNAKGTPGKIIYLWKSKAITLCINEETLEEYVDVLQRFDFVEKSELRLFLDLFNMRINVFHTRSKHKISVVKADPSDNKFLECAVATKAKFIISGDKHLLDLKKYKKIRIVSPSEFLTLFN